MVQALWPSSELTTLFISPVLLSESWAILYSTPPHARSVYVYFFALTPCILPLAFSPHILRVLTFKSWNLGNLLYCFRLQSRDHMARINGVQLLLLDPGRRKLEVKRAFCGALMVPVTFCHIGPGWCRPGRR